MKKSILNIFSLIALSFGVNAQNVNIPDANFKAYLVGNDLIDTNLDDEIQVSEASTFTGVISAGSLGINDMTGLEAFTSIQALFCQGNNLTSLNISSNTGLFYVECSSNSIASLDLSQNAVLQTLECGGNALTALDLSLNTALITLNCSSMNIGSLNLSQNPNLANLNCYNSSLNTLDISNNNLLGSLNCISNNLTVLDLANNTNLTQIQCGGNSIESLDLSNNTSLTSAFVNDNALTSLNMKNLSPLTLTSFNSGSNPNLSCIEVDNVADATASWLGIDPASSFSLNCVILVSSITVMGQAGANQITTNGGTLQMVANVLPVNADDATYTWSVTSVTGSASIDANGLLTAMSNGTVTVTATANDASGQMDSKVITISNQASAGINDQTASIGLKMYPNPAKNQLKVEALGVIESIVFINLTGEVVKTIDSPSENIDISALNKGVYLVKIALENQSVSQRLIKE